VEVKARQFRQYPFGAGFSHVVGYIGRIGEKDQERLAEAGMDANYKGTDHIGKLGIEARYEPWLHGRTGIEKVETDSGGRAVRLLSRSAPVAGYNLYLHLDARSCSRWRKRCSATTGAPWWPWTRATAACWRWFPSPASTPTCSSMASIHHLARTQRLPRPPPDQPRPARRLSARLHHQAVHGPGRPGTGRAPGRRHHFRPGYFTLPGSSHRYRDWKKDGHGMVDLKRSITISCDTYYYGLANQMGIERMSGFLSQFGFGKVRRRSGRRTGRPDAHAGMEEIRRFKQPWWPGETVVAGIGQGYVLTTPMQLAVATMAIANDGVLYKPQLIRAWRDPATGKVGYAAPQAAGPHQAQPEYLRLVKQAMVDVTLPGGTASIAGANAAYLFAGKTGTAQVVGIKQGAKYVESQVHARHRDHALFIAFAPADNPKIVIAVMVENGGHGGSTAAPVARKVIDYWLLGKLPTIYAPEEPADAAIPDEIEDSGPAGDEVRGAATRGDRAMIQRFLSRLVGPPGWPLMGLLALLLLISTAVVFSASGENTDRMISHLTNIGVALGAMLLVAHIPPQRLMQFAPPAYILGLLLLLGVAAVRRGGERLPALAGTGHSPASSPPNSCAWRRR
jgi:penicillin-binding protein 2